MFYDLKVLISIIHMVSSILWWSVTLFIIFVIRPLNDEGKLSIILPRTRNVVVYSSTISIIAGVILFMLNSNFNIVSIFYSLHNSLIFVSGILSLLVYFHILSQSPTFSSLRFVSKIFFRVGLSLPYILFSFLTLSLVIMLFVSNFF